ncbi:ABC transporter permease [Flaviflexus equikiangi]|uniref:ABC transporter permease subunit n=1 Tax=Flaviflexus equikiangi TaxID=2758573 RepID=A0ABS2TKJ8_9ACTO|nr:ABC transporter permease subunit [Flaviflexus equikiangi]MBM9433814.1 ABC transporter permease subunit [Flaviflexus equikiangi]
MTQYWILTRHELRGLTRTWRAGVVAGVVLALALIGPITTKFMPEILSMAGGFEIISGEPTWQDAGVQWASDLSQIIPLLAIMVSAVSLAQPLTSGSAALLLARPVPRSSLLFAGATANAIVIAGAVLAGALANSAMTIVLFGDGGIEPVEMALRWLVLMSVLLVAVAFGAARLGSTMGAAGTGLGTYFGLALLSALPPLRDYSPAGLFALEGGITWWWAASTSIVLVALGCAASARAFEKLPLTSSPHS